MTKRRADGNATIGKLEKAEALLYDGRADLQQVLREHDKRLGAVIEAVNAELKARIELYKVEVAKTNDCLGRLAVKRDNIAARLRGRKRLHTAMKETVQEVLRLAKAQHEYHSAALEALGGDVEISEFVAKLFADIEEGVDLDVLDGVDEALSDMDEPVAASPEELADDKDLEGIESDVPAPLLEAEGFGRSPVSSPEVS
jgi:hypothetical protein